MNFIIFSLIMLCHVTHGIRVQAIFQHVGKSHFPTFKSLLMGLSERGHHVTAISHFQLDKPMPNYTHIDLAGSIPIWESMFTADDFHGRGPWDRIRKQVKMAKVYISGSRSTCEALARNPGVQALKKGQFDVVLVEQFNSDCGMGIIHRLGAPFVGITCSKMMPFTRSRLGSDLNPGYVTNRFLGYGTKPDLWQTIESLFVNSFFRIVYNYIILPQELKILRDYYDKDTPPLESIAKNMDLLLTSVHFTLNGAQLMPPNIIEVAGLHLEYSKNKTNLDQGLQKFLDDSTQGVIIFSMGSLFKATSLPKEKIQAFQKAFSSIPQKILWKWDEDTMDGAPNNVKVLKWIPQFSALCHPNVKGFIGHGGLGGMMETIQVGMPVMVIPLFSDQFGNGQAAKEAGFGVVVKYDNISAESISWGISELLSERIQIRAKQVSAQWNDRPLSPMDTAVYWIEHVARHGGHLMRSPAVDVPWIRYYLLDVFAILIAIVLVVLFVAYNLIRLCLRLVCGKKTNHSQLNAKKKYN